MTGSAVEGSNFRMDRNVFSEELHIGGSILELPSQRCGRLVAHKEDDAFFSPQVVLQMVPNSTGFTHAGSREDHLRLWIRIDELGFLCRDRQRHTLRPDGVDALTNHCQSLRVKVTLVALQEDACGFHRQRRVHIYRKILMSLYQTLLLDLPDGIEHFLGSAHRKGGNHHIATPVKGSLNAVRKLCYRIAPDSVMETVTIGGFNHQIVRILHRFGVIQQRLIGIAHVTGKHDFPGFTLLRQPQFNGRRAQQMADIRHPQVNSLSYLQLFPIANRAQQFDGCQGIIHRVGRLHQRFACTLCLSAAPLGFRLLNMSRVPQHDIAQSAGCLRGIDRTRKTVLTKLGQHTGMVNVSMGQKYRFDGIGCYRQGYILEHIYTLFHAAVHQIVPPAYFQQCAAASNLMGGTDELYLHKTHLRIIYF